MVVKNRKVPLALSLALSLLPLVLLIGLRWSNQWTPKTRDDVQFEVVQYAMGRDLSAEKRATFWCLIVINQDGKNLQPVSSALLKRLHRTFPRVRWFTVSPQKRSATFSHGHYVMLTPTYQGFAKARVRYTISFDTGKKSVDTGGVAIVSRSPFPSPNRSWKVASI